MDIYVTLNSRDVEGKLLEKYGLEQSEEMETVKCPRCRHINPKKAEIYLRRGLQFRVEKQKQIIEEVRE